MKIYNSFGIKPTNTYLSAGSDYYIPNIITDEQKKRAKEAFKKSYKKTEEELSILEDRIINKYPQYSHQALNIIHLYLGSYIAYIAEEKLSDEMNAFDLFMEDILCYDKDKDVVGIKLDVNDHLFINSGIKVALDTVISEMEETDTEHPNIAGAKILRELGIGIAGLYVNKSGMGNKGWDVRACLVDEDYAGYVHLSMAYTKDVEREDGKNYIYWAQSAITDAGHIVSRGLPS